MNDQFLDTWNTHSQTVLFLLDAVEPEALPKAVKGRGVAHIFAHIHNVRLMWLKVSAPELMNGLTKIETKSKAGRGALTPDLLRPSLESSGQAIGRMFHKGAETGKIKSCQRHLVSCFGYFIAHEWYHISEICLTLTLVGHPLPDQVLYDLWEWNKR